MAYFFKKCQNLVTVLMMIKEQIQTLFDEENINIFAQKWFILTLFLSSLRYNDKF